MAKLFVDMLCDGTATYIAAMEKLSGVLISNGKAWNGLDWQGKS